MLRKPRDTLKKYTFMPPAYYAKGFSIFPVYKKKFDYTEMRKLFFLEDPNPKLVAKWGHLKSRLPLPESRVTNLPGTRDLFEESMKKIPPEVLKNMDKSKKEVEETRFCRCRNPDCPKKRQSCI